MITPPDRMSVIVLEIALVCIEAAISLLGGHSELGRIARDLEDVIEQEKRRLEERATS